MADPVDGAVLLFRAADRSIAEAFAKTGPYALNGLIKSWGVRKWSSVVGDDTANPVRA